VIAREIHVAEPCPTAPLENVVRLAGTLLCLAGVAVLVVAVRLGVYEYFHGDGRLLAWAWAWAALHAG
jgi:hypothetical protein